MKPNTKLQVKRQNTGAENEQQISLDKGVSYYQSAIDHATKTLKLDEARYKRYIKVFQMIDDDGSGKISKSEFKKALNKFHFGTNWSHETVDAMFDDIDEQKCGQIDIINFLNQFAKSNTNKNMVAMGKAILSSNVAKDKIRKKTEGDSGDEQKKLSHQAWMKKEEQYNNIGSARYAKEVLDMDEYLHDKYSKAFHLMDEDEGGSISKSEFIAVLNKYSLGLNLSKEEVNEIFDDVDKRDQGQINLMYLLESLSKNHINKSLLGIVNQVTSKADEIKESRKSRKSRNSKSGTIDEESPSSLNYKKFVRKLQAEESAKTEAKQVDHLDSELYAQKILHITDLRYKLCKRALRLMDIDGNGKISREELAHAFNVFELGLNLTKTEMTELIKEIDYDEDHHIDMNDLLHGACDPHISKKLIPIMKTIISMETDIKIYQKKFRAEKRRKTRLENPGEYGNESDDDDNYRGVLSSDEDETDAKKYAMSHLNMKDSEIKKYTKAFARMDSDGSGTITSEEYKRALSLKDKNLSNEDIDSMFSEIDRDSNGVITLLEFLKTVKKSENKSLVEMLKNLSKEAEGQTKTNPKDNKGRVSNLQSSRSSIKKPNKTTSIGEFDTAGIDALEYAENVLMIQPHLMKKYEKAFDLLDLNGNGSISKTELQNVIRAFSLIQGARNDDILSLFNETDKDKNGEICLLDFFKSLAGDNPVKKLNGIVETVLRKEKQILDYISKKGIKRQKKPTSTTRTSKLSTQQSSSPITPLEDLKGR